MKLVIASNNIHKIKEIRQMLGNDFEIVSMKEAGIDIEIIEDGQTFYDNALIKANAIKIKFNCAVLADDSGLIVPALQGEPGVNSARYAGEACSDIANNNKLLEKLKAHDRTAKFVCYIIIITENNDIISGYGETDGIILETHLGTNGFGYDSLFYSFELGKSFGEATDEEKNSVSHRGRALKDLSNKLVEKNIVFGRKKG